MADNSKSKKKGVFLLLGAFLLAGGGVFLFFIIQGADDLKGAKNANFSYGNIVRSSFSPFFKALGSLVEDEQTKKLNKMLALRDEVVAKSGMDVDVSDWMGANPASASAAPASKSMGRSMASARGPSAIPTMAGRGGGGIAGGGGSKSAGGLSGYDKSSRKGEVSVSAASGSGGGAGAKNNGLLDSLRGMRSTLGTALRSGSAMTAKSSWDKSFGLGTTGGRGGSGGSSGKMSYDKGGLVGLDKIKSGEINDLKTTNSPKAGGIPETSMPKLADNASRDEAASAVSSALSSIGSNLLNSKSKKTDTATDTKTDTDTDGDTKAAPDTKEPPEKFKNAIEKNVGYCASPCPEDSTLQYKDNAPVYTKTKDGWDVTVSGQMMLDGKEEGPYTLKYSATGDEQNPVVVRTDAKPLYTPPTGLAGSGTGTGLSLGNTGNSFGTGNTGTSLFGGSGTGINLFGNGSN